MCGRMDVHVRVYVCPTVCVSQNTLPWHLCFVRRKHMYLPGSQRNGATRLRVCVCVCVCVCPSVLLTCAKLFALSGSSNVSVLAMSIQPCIVPNTSPGCCSGPGSTACNRL